MTEVEDQIRAIQAQITQAQREQAKAEQVRNTAVANAAAAQKVLKEEFGVSGLPEARALLETLQEKFQATLAQIQVDVDKAAPKDGVYR